MSSVDEFKDEGAQSGYAEAAHWCPHVKDNVKPIDLREHETLDPNHTVCTRCPNTSENWLCLHCQQLFCGRFAQGHMLQHFESTGHCVAAGLGDLSFWCYHCESYLYHRTIPQIYSAYLVLHVLKFNEAPVDPPLRSAEPMTAISIPEAAGEGGEGEEEKGDDAHVDVDAEETDAHMETSRTAAMRSAPSRSSSQLEPFSSQESAGSQDESAPPSRSASELSAPSVACPIEGLSPLQMAHPLIQKILGVVYGSALGDAFGLATEFLDRKAVAQIYGPVYDPTTGAGAIPFPHVKKTRHSARWEHGDWTDDTDQMILILDTILETFRDERRFATDITPEPQRFAHKLRDWVRNGFPELGDEAGCGLGALTHQVVTHKLFLTDAHKAAEAVWSASGKKAAANGGLMRTSITAVFDYQHLDRVHANTRAMCGVTHADPRCLASCILIATAISGILQGAPISTPAETDDFLQHCLAVTLKAVPLGAHEEAFVQHFHMRELEEMKLDEPAAIGFTLKCMASGLFGLRSRESFAVTITRLTREAGDADTNAVVCGAMLGARVGYDGLPAAWLAALPHKQFLDTRVVQLVQLMFDRYEHEKQAAAAPGPAAGAGDGSAAAVSSSSSASAASSPSSK